MKEDTDINVYKTAKTRQRHWLLFYTVFRGLNKVFIYFVFKRLSAQFLKESLPKIIFIINIVEV